MLKMTVTRSSEGMTKMASSSLFCRRDNRLRLRSLKNNSRLLKLTGNGHPSSALMVGLYRPRYVPSRPVAPVASEG